MHKNVRLTMTRPASTILPQPTTHLKQAKYTNTSDTARVNDCHCCPVCRTYDCALTTLRVALAFAQDLVTAALVDGHGTLGAAVALLSKSPAGRKRGGGLQTRVRKSKALLRVGALIVTYHKNP